MGRTARKWWAVFSIYFQDALAYRAQALIWITMDLVTAVTMPLIWANAQRSGPIGGYTTSDFILYYLCMLLLGCFVTSHMMWDVAMEVREGVFTTSLVRPISFYQVIFFRNLSWRIMRTGLFVPLFLGLLYLYRGMIGEASFQLGPAFWLSLLLGHLVSLTSVMMVSSIALYVTEATSLFELYYLPMMFLSGQLFPVAVLPDWLRSAAYLFPFYFTTGAPTEILIGRVSGEAVLPVLGGQVFWVAFCYGVSKLLWARGLRCYTAVGM